MLADAQCQQLTQYTPIRRCCPLCSQREIDFSVVAMTNEHRQPQRHAQRHAQRHEDHEVRQVKSMLPSEWRNAGRERFLNGDGQTHLKKHKRT